MEFTTAKCDGFHKGFLRYHCDFYNFYRLNRPLFYIVLGVGIVLPPPSAARNIQNHMQHSEIRCIYRNCLGMVMAFHHKIQKDSFRSLTQNRKNLFIYSDSDGTPWWQLAASWCCPESSTLLDLSARRHSRQAAVSTVRWWNQNPKNLTHPKHLVHQKGDRGDLWPLTSK